MTDRDAFVKILEENEDDTLTRLIFADWLEEHGEPEEAERQRRWPAAKAWLLDFARRWNFFEADYSYGSDVSGSNPNALKQMIVEAIDGEYLIAVGTDLHGADQLDAGDEDLFWENMEIVTGRHFDQAHRSNFGWSCSC